MASVIYPNLSNRKGIHREGTETPYIMSGQDGYPEGINHYLDERAKGRIPRSGTDAPLIKIRKLSKKSKTALIYRVCDALTWVENYFENIRNKIFSVVDLRQWMFETLYEQAMSKGYWSAEFWRSGHPSGLNHPNTIRPRVEEAVRAGKWMEKMGYAPNFSIETSDEVIARELSQLTAHYERYLSRASPAVAAAGRWEVRRNPADITPASAEELLEFINALRTKTARLAALLLFETGMRADELLNSTKIPPSWHGIKTDKLGGVAIGYLPEFSVIFPSGAHDLKKCQWKVLGKGKKIRFVMIPPKLLQALWTYATTRRQAILRKTRSVKEKATDELFLNRDGGPLNYGNLAEAFRQANIDVGRDERITAHILRHAYACKFLEVNIDAELRNSGIDPANATYEQIMSRGQGILIILQGHLGHEFQETTAIYLEQLARGKISLRYQAAFNAALDTLDNRVTLV